MKATALLLVSGLALAGCGQSAKNGSNAAAANNVQAAPANASQNAAAPAAAAPAAQTGGAMTPDQVRAMMQRDGVGQTLQNPAFAATSQAMSEGISSGDEQWLALVPLLSTSGSAEVAEGLIGEVAEALPRNAAGVLRALSGRQVEDSFKEVTCFHPEEMSGQAARTYLAEAIRAVEAVNDAALQAAKTRCLANLRQARSDVGA